MKTLTTTEFVRNFSSILDELESGQEEVVLTRYRRVIARLIPEPSGQNALEVLGDIYRTLDDEAADALTGAIKTGRKTKRGTLSELRRRTSRISKR